MGGGGRRERRWEEEEGGRRGGEAAGCSAEEDVAGPAELATSDGQRSHEPDHPQAGPSQV